MIIKFILLQLLAHLLGDFIFQPHKWTIKKREKIITYYHIWHILIITVLSFILSFDKNFIFFALALGIIHLGIDVSKSFFQLKTNLKDSKLFFIDQFLHIVTLLIISVIYVEFFSLNFIIDIPLNYIIITVGFVFCAKPANIFIKNIFNLLSIETHLSSNNEKKDEDLPNAGKVIGVMERFIVLALSLIGQFAAIGLIIAAKSILRYNNMKKNEYVLVGTLLSFGIAIIIGVLSYYLLK